MIAGKRVTSLSPVNGLTPIAVEASADLAKSGLSFTNSAIAAGSLETSAHASAVFGSFEASTPLLKATAAMSAALDLFWLAETATYAAICLAAFAFVAGSAVCIMASSRRVFPIVIAIFNAGIKPGVASTFCATCIARISWASINIGHAASTTAAPKLIAGNLIGPAPARNVTVAHAIVPHPRGTSNTSLDSSLAKLCEEAEKSSNIDKIGGPSVFPGQIRSIERAAGSEPIYKADEPVLFSVQGCADYTFGDGRHGKTAFRMLLGHAGPVFWEGLRFQPSPPPDGKIALGKTTLDRAQFDFKEDPSGGNYLR